MTTAQLAASPVPYERVFAPLACTLLVACALWAAAPTNPAAGECGSEPAKIACDVSAQYAPPASWYGDAALRDPDSASETDDDDDDVTGGGDAAIAVDVAQPAAHHMSVRIEETGIIWTSRTADGHSLRGPPAVEKESTDLELLDDDNDDDDAAVAAVVAIPFLHSASRAASAGPSPATSFLSLHRAQRAPPISSS
jgi:hypothetical protein